MHFTLMVVVCLLQILNCADPKVIYKAMNLECFPNPKRIENHTCTLKAVNWNKATVTVDGDLIFPLHNLSIRFEVYKKGYSNQYHPFLINVTFNMCDLLSRKSFTSYGMLFYKIVKDYTNANHPCPISNHVFVRNFFVNETMVPNFPLGFYMIVGTLTESFADRPSDLIGVVKYYIQAMEMVKMKPRTKFNNSSHFHQ